MIRKRKIKKRRKCPKCGFDYEMFLHEVRQIAQLQITCRYLGGNVLVNNLWRIIERQNDLIDKVVKHGRFTET